MDQVAALMTFITGEAFIPGRFRAEFNKTAIGVRNNVPGVLDQLDLEDAQDVDQAVVPWSDRLITVPVSRKLFSHWLHPWAAKQTCAMWTEQTGKIIRPDQRIIVQWIPNPVDVSEDFLRTIERMMVGNYHLSQGRVSYSDQFYYKFVVSEDAELGAFFLILHEVTAVLCYVVSEDHARTSLHTRYGQIFETNASAGTSRTL